MGSYINTESHVLDDVVADFGGLVEEAGGVAEDEAIVEDAEDADVYAVLDLAMSGRRGERARRGQGEAERRAVYAVLGVFGQGKTVIPMGPVKAVVEAADMGVDVGGVIAYLDEMSLVDVVEWEGAVLDLLLDIASALAAGSPVTSMPM